MLMPNVFVYFVLFFMLNVLPTGLDDDDFDTASPTYFGPNMVTRCSTIAHHVTRGGYIYVVVCDKPPVFMGKSHKVFDCRVFSSVAGLCYSLHSLSYHVCCNGKEMD